MEVGDKQRIEAAEKALGVVFADRSLLLAALTHSSYLNEHPGRADESNERLEFLGDAVVGAAVAEALYLRYPEMTEGDLTAFRASVVNGESLAELAKELSLGEHLRMGRGEEASGGRERVSNLGSAFESVVGALYLDQGYGAAHAYVLSRLGPLLEAGEREPSTDNPKSALQEATQARGSGTPVYRIVSECGEDHQRTFVAEVLVDGAVKGRGAGSRKAHAEREAAREAMRTLET